MDRRTEVATRTKKIFTRQSLPPWLLVAFDRIAWVIERGGDMDFVVTSGLAFLVLFRGWAWAIGVLWLGYLLLRPSTEPVPSEGVPPLGLDPVDRNDLEDRVFQLEKENKQLKESLREKGEVIHDLVNERNESVAQIDSLRSRATKLEEELSDLKPQPPISDLSEQERVLAFQEIAKIVEAIDGTHSPTFVLFHEMVGRMQGVERDTPAWFLGMFVKEAVVAPLDGRLAAAKLSLANGDSAEEAQEDVFQYVWKYDSARKWMERAARYSGDDITNDHRYADWHEKDCELFATIKRCAPKNGRALGLLRERLDNWYVIDEVPAPMPDPRPEPMAELTARPRMEELPLGSSERSVSGATMSGRGGGPPVAFGLRRIHVVNHGEDTFLRDWEVWYTHPTSGELAQAQVMSRQQLDDAVTSLTFDVNVGVISADDHESMQRNQPTRFDVAFMVAGLDADDVWGPGKIVEVRYRDGDGRQWRYGSGPIQTRLS